MFQFSHRLCKHWYWRKVDSQLRLGETRIPKSEFISLYAKARPKAITAKNIESSFRKTGLVPFNPVTVLRQLPIAPPTPLKPAVPAQLQTPQNVQDLEKIQQILGDSDTTPIYIAWKVLKVV